LLRDLLRRNAVPIVLLLLAAFAALAAGYLTGPDIQSVSNDSLRISTGDGSLTLKLDGTTAYEALRPAGRSAIRTGDWANVGTTPHMQTLFVISGIVLIPQALLESAR
jgi:hypothetical protein